MREIFCVVPKVDSFVVKLLRHIWFLIAIEFIFFGIFNVSSVLLLIGLIFGVVWYFQDLKYSREFEYTYYEHELYFAKIKNKARRKELCKIDLNEAILIAPKGANSLHQYEQGHNTVAKVRKLISGVEINPVYKIVYKNGNALEMIVFEPEEKLLTAIGQRYPQLVQKGV